MPWSGPAAPSTAPGFRLRVVFARDDASARAEPSSGPRLMIVEDDYLVATQMADSLRDAGFEVAAVAASAEEAVAHARNEAISFAIMDVRLSGERDGVDCALELFSAHGIRCIFATAHGDPHVKARAAPAKPLGWIQKPYSMASLIANVRQTVDGLD
jgi:DNA-binding response OmpR family regulator